MTLPKGHTRISIKKSTERRLNNVRKIMEESHPDKYDETTSFNTVIDWLIDHSENNRIKL